MSAELDSALRTKILQATAAVTFYMAVSIGSVFLNRIVLTDKTEPAGALFVSWYQFVVAYALILIITVFFQSVPVLNLFPPIHYNLQSFMRVLPVSITFLLMIGLNNKCLEYVSVSSYQIVRSLSIVFNIILTFIILREKTSIRSMLACFGVVIGFAFGVEGELGLSVRGAIYGVISSVFAALYAIVVKRALSLLDGNEYLLIEYNTPIAIVALTPSVWIGGEFSVLREGRSMRFWGMQTFAGIVGFIINIAVFLNIKYTSALTHNLTGTVKSCLQTILAFFVFRGTEVMTRNKFIGIVLVIGFSTYYIFVRRIEMKQKLLLEQEAVAEINEDEQAAVDPLALIAPGFYDAAELTGSA
jgi:GDP-fucose transporter C1